MKKLFVILVVVFCSVASYAGESDTTRYVRIEMSDGKIIKKGPNKGKVGFEYVYVTDSISTEDNKHRLIIICGGKGLNPFPEQYRHHISKEVVKKPSKISDEIIAKVCERIDLGETAGSFELKGYSCTWENGKKRVDKEKPIYEYKLVIKSKSTN